MKSYDHVISNCNSTWGKTYLECSLNMEADPEDWRGYFMASAFYVVGCNAK